MGMFVVACVASEKGKGKGGGGRANGVRKMKERGTGRTGLLPSPPLPPSVFLLPPLPFPFALTTQAVFAVTCIAF